MSQMPGDIGSRECPSFGVQAVRMRERTQIHLAEECVGSVVAE